MRAASSQAHVHACSVSPDQRERAQLCQQRPRVSLVQAQELQRALQGHANPRHGRQALGRLLALPGMQCGSCFAMMACIPVGGSNGAGSASAAWAL